MPTREFSVPLVGCPGNELRTGYSGALEEFSDADCRRCLVSISVNLDSRLALGVSAFTDQIDLSFSTLSLDSHRLHG
jgi:hypothetical protein